MLYTIGSRGWTLPVLQQTVMALSAAVVDIGTPSSPERILSGGSLTCNGRLPPATSTFRRWAIATTKPKGLRLRLPTIPPDRGRWRSFSIWGPSWCYAAVVPNSQSVTGRLWRTVYARTCSKSSCI
jgi:hypothetical protein